MATDQSPTNTRGLLIMDPRITEASLWSAESSYTQAGPVPGDPVPQGDYDLVVSAVGSQSASKELRIQTLRSGHPIPDGGAHVWQYNGDANWRGWDPPNVLTHWEALVYSTTANITADPHIVSLRSGVVLVVAEELSGADYVVEVRIRTAASPGVWSSVEVYNGGTSKPANGFNPCLLQLPNDRVLLFHWIEDSTNDLNQVRVWQSDDDGTTWTLYQTSALRSGLDTSSTIGAGNAGGDPGRLRGAYKDGQVMLVAAYRVHDSAAVERGVFVQYASDDYGANFDEIAIWDKTVSTEGGRFHDVIVSKGRFGLLYHGRASTGLIKMRRVGSAFSSLVTAPIEATIAGTWGTVVGNEVTEGDLAACVDTDDTIYLTVRGLEAATEWKCVIARSLDGGNTWEDLGNHSSATLLGDGGWWVPNANGVYPFNFAACCHRGRVLVVSNVVTPDQYDSSLFVTYLGGPSTFTMPPISPEGGSSRRLGWIAGGQTWVAYDQPDGVGWTAAGAGAGTLASGALNIDTVANNKSYSIVPVASIAGGIMGRFRATINSAGSLTADAVALRVRLDDGVNANDVSFRLTSTTLRVHDNLAGAAVAGGDGTHTGTIEVIFAMQGDNLVTVYRDAPDNGEDREYTTGVGTGALTDSTAAANIVRMGNISASTNNSDWYEVHFTTEETIVHGAMVALAAGFTNPDDLNARDYNRKPVYVDDGLSIQAQDGAAVIGQSYHIDTRYRFPIERIFHQVSRSPRVRYRTTAETQATVAIYLDDVLLGTDQSEVGSDLVGIGLFGINFRTAELQYYDSVGATWVKLIEIDAATGMDTMEFVREGNSIRPNNPTDKPYLSTGEAVGWTFKLESGETAQYRRVNWNREGRFDNAYAGPNLHLHLNDVLAGDLANGTGQLWANNVVAIGNMLGQQAAGWRLMIDAQTTADGYFEIGQLVVGPVIVYGTQYSWGRTIENDPGVVREVGESGASRAKEARPNARTWSFGWVDGVDVSNVYSTDPDYVVTSTTANAESVATRYGTPLEIEGMQRLVRSGLGVILTKIPKSTGGASTDTFNLVRLDDFGLVSLGNNVRREGVIGDEQLSIGGEVFRVASVVLQEEV